MSYLELGVDKMSNFNAINAGEKYCVDVNGNALFTGTTDQWFSGPGANRTWDIIFIDANHDSDYLLRDYNNSVTRCRRWLIIHDMIPPDLLYTESYLCSDSFRILYHLLKYEDFRIYPMDTNYGLTLIKMPARPINPTAETLNIPYSEFVKFMNCFKLYSTDEMVKILQEDS
jgi:hypothetical protein